MNAGQPRMIQRVYRHWSLTTGPRDYLAPCALVSWPVLLLFSILTAATVTMTFYWMALIVLVHFAGGKCSAQCAAAVERCTPSGLFSWMRQATHGTGSTRETDGTWAREWCFGPVLGQEGTGLVRVGGIYDQSEPLTAETRIKKKPVFVVASTPVFEVHKSKSPSLCVPLRNQQVPAEILRRQSQKHQTGRESG
jgi:hypothetical protein